MTQNMTQNAPQITLTAEQISVKKDIRDYLDQSDGSTPFILAGSAGVGKTTLVSSLLEDMRSQFDGTFKLIAPTGKATSVLNRKQNVVRAQTAHSMLYERPNSTLERYIKQKADLIKLIIPDLEGNFRKRGLDRQLGVNYPRYLLEQKAEQAGLVEQVKVLTELIKTTKEKLTFTPRSPEQLRENITGFICDEASMVNRDLARDLAFGVPSVFIGDSKQLPPVEGGFGIDLNRPTRELTQILRQKGDSGILDLAYEMIKGVVPSRSWFSSYNDLEISSNPNPLAYLGGPYRPQFLSFRNDYRHSVNPTIRRVHLAELGIEPNGPGDNPYPDLVYAGETLMVDSRVKNRDFTKGDLVVVEHAALESTGGGLYYKLTVRRADDEDSPPVVLSAFLNDLAKSVNKQLVEHDVEIQQRARKRVLFQYPYALTVHKAQGSEFDYVVYYIDSKRDPQLMYTAVTRARELLSVVIDKSHK